MTRVVHGSRQYQARVYPFDGFSRLNVASGKSVPPSKRIEHVSAVVGSLTVIHQKGDIGFVTDRVARERVRQRTSQSALI